MRVNGGDLANMWHNEVGVAIIEPLPNTT